MYVVKRTNFTLPCRILANRTVFENKPDRFAQGVVYDDIRVVSDIVVDTPGKIIYRPLDQNRFISIQLAESFPRQLTLKRNRAIVFQEDAEAQGMPLVLRPPLWLRQS